MTTTRTPAPTPRPSDGRGAPVGAASTSTGRGRSASARRTVRALLALLVVTAVGVAGCSLPSVDVPDGEPSAGEAPLASEPPDPSEQRVRAAVDDLLTTIAAARGPLEEATGADTADAVRQRAQTALAALVGDRGQGAPPRTGPLFPDETTERGSATDADDQLTATLTAARDGGAPGSELLELLRDPIAGDLGAWQRDAAGVLASVEAAVAGGADLDQLEVEIDEIAGLGTRAVAWTLLASEATDGGLASAYAERGAANLEIIVVTLERFLAELDDGDGTGDTEEGA